MRVNAHLDIDLIALDEAQQVTCLLELTAPEDPLVAQRPGRTLVVVLDRSGSMTGGPLDAARRSLIALTRRLGPQDSFGLVTFDDVAELVVPVRSMADHSLAEVLRRIEAVYPGGMTNLSAGYLLALREVKASLATTGHSSATVLLLSDGHANQGITDHDRLHDLARSAATESIVTSTVGLGLGYDEDLLNTVASGGNGNHRFADSADAAAAEITQTVSDLLDVSVLAATVRIAPLDPAVHRVTVRHDVLHWADEQCVVIALGDMYGGEERRLLVQFGVDAVADLGTRTIAELQVQFTEAGTLAEHRVTLPVVVNVVPGDEARSAVPNPVVEVEQLVVELDEVKQTAIKALHLSDPDLAKDAIASALLAAREMQSKAGELAPPMAARLDATVADLCEAEANLESMDGAYTSKRLMESMASSRGKSNRKWRSSTPPTPDPSDPA